MASGQATGTFKKRAPGILFFFLKTAVNQVFWLDRLNGKLEFSRAYAPDKTDFRVYSIKRRGVYCFFSYRIIWFPHGRLLNGGVFFSLSYLLNFVTQYYVKGTDRESVV